MKVLPWIVLAVMLPSWSWARLGETPEQCEERYGAPIPNKELPTVIPRASVLCYHARGFKILIVFTNGKAGQIFYQKLMENPYEEAKALSEAEINWLLEANAGGKTWEGGYAEQGVNSARQILVIGIGATLESAGKQAITDAVRRAVGAYVDANTIVENEAVIKDRILSVSSGFVKECRWSRAKQRDDGLYELQILATVQTGQVVQALKESNLITGEVAGANMWAEASTTESQKLGFYIQKRWTLSDQSASAVYDEGVAYDAIQDSMESCFLLITTTEFRKVLQRAEQLGLVDSLANRPSCNLPPCSPFLVRTWLRPLPENAGAVELDGEASRMNAPITASPLGAGLSTVEKAQPPIPQPR